MGQPGSGRGVGGRPVPSGFRTDSAPPNRHRLRTRTDVWSMAGVPLGRNAAGMDPARRFNGARPRRPARSSKARGPSRLQAHFAEKRTRLVAVSEFTRVCVSADAQSGNNGNVRVIRNGLAALPLLCSMPVPAFTGGLRLGYVGRFEGFKGVFDSLHSVSASPTWASRLRLRHLRERLRRAGG